MVRHPTDHGGPDARELARRPIPGALCGAGVVRRRRGDRALAEQRRAGTVIPEMTALPLAVKAALAAVLLGSIVRAFFGAPPRRSAVRAARLVALAGLTTYGAGAATLVAGHPTAAGTLVGAAVEALCLAVWLARTPDDGGDGGPVPDGPPIDWDELDRLRAGWRPRDPDPVG